MHTYKGIYTHILTVGIQYLYVIACIDTYMYVLLYYIFVFESICMYTYVYVCTCMYMYVYVCIRMYMQVCMYIHVLYVYVRMHVYVCIDVDVCICSYVCIFIYVRMNLSVRMFIYTYMHIWTYMYVYACIPVTDLKYICKYVHTHTIRAYTIRAYTVWQDPWWLAVWQILPCSGFFWPWFDDATSGSLQRFAVATWLALAIPTRSNASRPLAPAAIAAQAYSAWSGPGRACQAHACLATVTSGESAAGVTAVSAGAGEIALFFWNFLR